MDRGSDIYFAVSESGTIKVGRSSNVGGRIEQLRCPDGGKVRLLSSLRGVGPYEKTIHRFLAEDALGGEWFTCSESVMRVTRARSGEELLRMMGVKRRIAAPFSGEITEKDREELDTADTLRREGIALKARVKARIRQRRRRMKLADPAPLADML